MRFAQTVIPDPILIRLKREEQSLDTIKQFYVSYENQLYSSPKVIRHYQLLHSMKGGGGVQLNLSQLLPTNSQN